MPNLIFENYQEKKSHVSPDFPFNIYPCSIPVDFEEVPLHWHDEFEIISIKKGQGMITINLTSYSVAAGDIIIIRPGHLHSIHQCSGCTMEYENILFQLNFLIYQQIDLCGARYFHPFLRPDLPLPAVINHTFSYYHDLELCIRQLDLLCSREPYAWQISVKAHLLQFFFILFNNNNMNACSPVPEKAYEGLRVILKYIELHYSEPITISEVAEAAGYSVSYFMRFFKTHMKITFTQYLNNYRLAVAARHLSSSKIPVLEISAMTGFQNLSYFNRLFQKKYHMTPTAYRRQHTDEEPSVIVSDH